MRPVTQAALWSLALPAVHGPAYAAVDTFDCALSRDGVRMNLRFDLDPASFSPPVDPADPPRRRISRVRMADAEFEAEAILGQDGSHGFWAATQGMLMTVAPDGTARMSDHGERPWQGQCREIG
ncbi:hypothetical protein [Mameliella alba]|uniref:hypothetical protein n=1 Tax=Mameliella alba TaxID=561184 RepID=UPI000B52D2A5|nr:hypothetical protein [Mameliella alba]MBY6119863.1 hypothetical protein [Mameliella alba]OWV45426.1 hypothetical protein CDZ95_00185 [Mameliella alba]OWV65842.1 hypothetical protein CDZ97_08245 [Mameliella alba]